MVAVGYGKVLPADVVEAVLPEADRKVVADEPAPAPVSEPIKKIARPNAAGIQVAG